jgi:hypothetical protein
VKKFAVDRPFADPDVGSRKIVEIANGIEAEQDGRILIERINALFLAAGGKMEPERPVYGNYCLEDTHSVAKHFPVW